MNPADPAAVPPPEWAVKMAESLMCEVLPGAAPTIIQSVAARLASVSEASVLQTVRWLRERADWHRESAEQLSRTSPDQAHVFAVRANSLELEADAILSLLHTPPSGGGE